ncbi:MAG TPA: hypothetical protein VGM23_01070 [Armatimonadota bacterium]|jgi:uncharacterized membrane protein YeiH
MRYPLWLRFILSLLIGFIILGNGLILVRTELPLWILIIIAVLGGVLFGGAISSILRNPKSAELRRNIIITAIVLGAILFGFIIGGDTRSDIFVRTALSVAGVLTLAIDLVRLFRMRREQTPEAVAE